MTLRIIISKEKLKELHEFYMSDRYISIETVAKKVPTSGKTMTKIFRESDLEIKCRGGKGNHGCKKITLICEVCRKEFDILERVYRSKKGKIYCSKKCSDISKIKPESHKLMICDNCGKEFNKRTDLITEHNYCSKHCSNEGRKSDYAKWRDAEYIRNYQKKYQEENKEKIYKNKKEYYATHNEKILSMKHKYRVSHRIQLNNHNSFRYDVKANGNFSESDWKSIKEKYDHRCLKCGKQEPEIKLSVDHIIPLILGGKNIPENIQPLCTKCNSSKGKKIIDYRLLKGEDF
jgi:5-methylcytosine-specific restriction endonuclease McrA